MKMYLESHSTTLIMKSIQKRLLFGLWNTEPFLSKAKTSFPQSKDMRRKVFLHERMQ